MSKIPISFLVFLIIQILFHLSVCNDPRIYGGRPVKLGEYPMMIQIRGIGFHKHICGAFLISKSYALTAAHCLPKYVLCQNVYRLLLGDITLDSKPTSPRSRQELSPLYCVAHSDFNPSTLEDDIAMIKLPSHLKLSANVQPVNYTHHPREFGLECETMGWGRTNRNSPHLMATRIEILKDNICEEGFRNYFPEKSLCVGDLTGKNDSCIGDSGGPLICRGIAYGLVSFGKKQCASPGVGAVYTDLYYYNDWIKQQIKRMNEMTFNRESGRYPKVLLILSDVSLILSNVFGNNM